MLKEQSLILALDIGTSSTRAILYDAQGSPVEDGSAQLSYTVTTSHAGEASVDARFLTDLVARSIDQVLSLVGERAHQIRAVATSAFWHTLVPLDVQGEPLMPLLTWEDTRPQQVIADLRARLDEAAVHQRTGTRLHASYWPAKIAWLAEAYPDIARRAARYVSFGEYLYQQVLGSAVCSLSMASGTGLFNRQTGTWDEELLAMLHLTPAHFSPLGDFAESASGLLSTFASRWPALQGVPWFPAIGDGAAANIGSVCLGIETWAVTMGTSSALRVVVPPGGTKPAQGLWLYSVDQRRALLGGALSEGGNMLAWLQRHLQLPAQPALDKQLADLAPASHGLTILPLLAGERSPGWHTDARMTISGLTLHTTSIEIAQAALEAVIFQISRIYDQLCDVLAPPSRPRLIVNGAALLKSAILAHILADTLNCSLELSEGQEASSRGVALLALEALGLLPDLADLVPTTSSIVQPDPARHAIYTRARAQQQQLYDLLFP
jgi:gluconokinase